METLRIRLISLLLLPFCCIVTFAQTQDEMNQEACVEYKKADAELNKVYQQVLNAYQTDALFIRKMKIAQRAWVVYRDAHVDSVYPIGPTANPRLQYGTVYPMCRCTTLLDTTKKRVEELRQWIKGLEEGDVCAGSIKVVGLDAPWDRTHPGTARVLACE